LTSAEEPGATARLANDFETLKGFFATLTEPCRAVVEPGWNWGVMYDWLDVIDNVCAVELAHPYPLPLSNQMRFCGKIFWQISVKVAGRAVKIGVKGGKSKIRKSL
jgi:hypothetical protein